MGPKQRVAVASVAADENRQECGKSHAATGHEPRSLIATRSFNKMEQKTANTQGTHWSGNNMPSASTKFLRLIKHACTDHYVTPNLEETARNMMDEWVNGNLNEFDRSKLGSLCKILPFPQSLPFFLNFFQSDCFAHVCENA